MDKSLGLWRLSDCLVQTMPLARTRITCVQGYYMDFSMVKYGNEIVLLEDNYKCQWMFGSG